MHWNDYANAFESYNKLGSDLASWSEMHIFIYDPV